MASKITKVKFKNGKTTTVSMPFALFNLLKAEKKGEPEANEWIRDKCMNDRMVNNSEQLLNAALFEIAKPSLVKAFSGQTDIEDFC